MSAMKSFSWMVVFGAAMAATAAAETGMVAVPDGRLHYEATGSGPAVVLLHDGLVDSTTWDRQLPAFRPFFRTIRYDRRGYGRSESTANEHSDVADLLAVLDTLRVEDAVLVGCSAGGGLALDFAVAHPARVRALVLVGPVVSGFDYTEHFFGRNFANFRPVFESQDVAAAVARWVEDPWLTDARNGEARAFLREALTKHPEAVQRKTPRSTPPEKPALARLGEIRVPTLIVVGASDIPDVHAHVGAIAAGIRGAERTVVPDAGHLVHLERPDVFNARVLSFLRPAEEAAAWVASTRSDAVYEKGKVLLAYDARAPLDVQERSSETRGGTARVRDLDYASPKGGRVPAYLVEPTAPGRHAAIVFVHHGQGDRKTFLDEAVALAPRGVVSLLLDAPEVRPGANAPDRKSWDPVVDPAERIQGIVDVERAFDLLASRPDVDQDRLAYVGYSLGATLGATLAGVETRPRGFVMMAGYPSLTHVSAFGRHPGGVAFRTLLSESDRKRWLDAMEAIDGVHFAGKSRAAFLLQFASRDEFISRWDAAAYGEEVGGEKTVEWYDADHFGLGAVSREARTKWLAKLLALR
jgi:pimeloyl-ACP methyl ester carboxylesterase